ncbi:MAG: dTMP kinase [Spirochaetia bacterium]|nr:dTMP kinase [Spirochaetia bacterium]MDD7268506.1 dTMP kinase [Treponema sp.]MDY4985959.1 dTMP kinase [Treponema sp.]
MVLENFIVFEGIDGAGTSTQIKKLVESNPEKYVATAEPTTNETGKFLRRMLAGEFKVDEKTSSYLFAADRCEHIYGEKGVINMLKQGKTVVSDRYFFSSLAYQSVSCGKELPRLVNSPFPLPEYLFYFDINPEISLARVTSRGEKTEIYEQIDMQKKTAALYEEVISEYEADKSSGMKVIRVDATKSIDEVAAFIADCLKK